MSSTVLAAEPPAVGVGVGASVLGAGARALEAELSALVGVVDGAAGSGALEGADAAELVEAFAAMERLAAAGKTLAAGRVAETGHYRALGFPSAARWLADRTKCGAGGAAQALATASHVGDERLAATRAAMVSGALTEAQAGEIARTAAGAPAEQERLLRVAARETAAELRDECRRVRLAGRPAEEPGARRRRVAEEMSFGARDLGDGMGELFARMPSTWLVLVLAAVREQSEVIFQRARAEGRADPHAAYLVEALVTLLLFGNLDGGSGGSGASEAGGSVGDVDEAGAGEADDDGDEPMVPDNGDEPMVPQVGHVGGAGDDDVARDAGSDDGIEGCGAEDAWFDDPLYRQLLASISGEAPPAPPPRGQRRRMRRGRCRCGGRVVPRAKIIVRVDQAALLRGWVEGGETCAIAGVGPVPVSTVRELWPDAVVKLVVTRGVDVVNVTHLGRRATEAMATAMQWQSVRCANIACDNDRFVEVDHRLGWANVHRTRVDELDGLCGACHHSKTNDNWQLVRGQGRRRFVPPEHPDHPGDPPTPRRRD